VQLNITNYELLTSLFLLLILNSCNQFDSGTPDTRNNKFHFKNFLNVEITPDVKNIYTFGDELGIDAKYMIAFNCNGTTANKIIEVNEFKADNSNQDGYYIQAEHLKWWDRNEVIELPKYSWNDGNYFKYFWYDSIKEKAYYLDFDL
jgi:hypothetical protein